MTEPFDYTPFIALVRRKQARLQYVVLPNGTYKIWFTEGLIEYRCLLPDNEDYAGYRTDFNLNWASEANASNAPRTSDGKPIFLPNLFNGGVILYVCGAADHPANGVGEGDKFAIHKATVGQESLSFSFNDWIYLAGGSLTYDGCGRGDHCDFELLAKPSTVAEANPGDGNCILYPYPALAPDAYLVFPAPPEVATHVVDLNDIDSLTPIPAEDENGIMYGWWCWNDPDTGKGQITAGTAFGTGKYQLFTRLSSIDPLAINTESIVLSRFAAKVHLLGTKHTNLTVPAIKPKKILPHWHLRVTLFNASGNDAYLTWALTSARVRTR